MLHVRTVLGIALVPVLLSLTVTTAVAGWQLTFEPDVSTFKIKDVITGRTHIRYLAKGRDSGGQSVSVRCAEVQFLVTGPDGSTIAMIQKSRNDHAESWPINLSDREEVLLPVCLAKWAGQFVFSIEGEYRILVSLTLVDMQSNKSSIATAAPVSIRIASAGDVPQSYQDALDSPAICGAFRYGCRTISVLRMREVDFGEYNEPFFAFMTYQLWHTGAKEYILAGTRKSIELVDIGMSVYRSRTGSAHCRGDWLIERLEAMRAARAGKPYDGIVFGAGELVFAWPEML
ncbi:MAG: hypothetical protein IPH86_07425 [bacterium]|nr:hypothetical protein [bacterium]